MSRPTHDPSVRGEPHFREDSGETGSVDSVWDEPSLAPELAGPPPEGAATYANRLLAAKSRTPRYRTWLVTGAVALAAGPWAVLGAFLGAQGADSAVLVVVVVAPLTEEVLKVSAPLLVVEIWPHLFSCASQILLASVASGFVFAAIENVIYLYVYIPQPSEELIRWRWTVCVAVHVVCSLVAGVGVAKVWRGVWARLSRPRLESAFAYIAAAAIAHGAYNAFATVRAVLDAR